MQVPETPKKLSDLTLMQQLERYATGEARWDPLVDVGPDAQTACKALHVNVTLLVEKALAPILDRITSREMDTFTMHDRTHGLKVAHLMWQILDPSRRERLTPPEIALLVLAAHFHDIGMALTKEERTERLRSSSNLWEKLDIHEGVKERMEKLRADITSPDIAVSRKAKPELNQMEEALLSQDTRERHATRERYEQVLATLREFHRRDPENVPGIDECLSFDGNSFRDKLVDICVSHNEDAEAVVRRDVENPARPRFPVNFPIGTCTADLHMVAAALRLADILDFDRERTPPVLFYYLLPIDLAANENRSILEWGKHMSISHWHIDADAVVFRGRCKDHIIHHAIVLFCSAIQEEIHATRATFGALKEQAWWPFNLPGTVTSEIHEEGYHYVHYRFELDDQRIYSLLMGGAIYDNAMVAVRELVQNAVDACRLRDALTQFYEPYTPVTTNRIFVTYEEPNETHDVPLLSVSDTGTGMDAFILQRYFLKVGQSYYNSQEFKRERLELRKNSLDFAPISEFGIGFLSCFLLADRVQVETAMSESPRGDTRKRTLLIDGPTRLIRLNEDPNEGSKRFKGTRITLYLRRGIGRVKDVFPQWREVTEYLESVCRELPYRVHLQHSTVSGVSESYLDPSPLKLEIPSYLDSAVLHIPVNDEELGLEGEIGLTNFPKAQALERQLFGNMPFALGTDSDVNLERQSRFGPPGGESELRRGGFKIGAVPGLPRIYADNQMVRCKVRLTWNSRKERRYFSPNLARNGTANDSILAQGISRAWLSYLLEHSGELPEGQLNNLSASWRIFRQAKWLENFNAYHLYQLARLEWLFNFKETDWQGTVEKWEKGSLDRIWLGRRSDLSHELLEMILPRISKLILAPGGIRYVSRPVEGWVQLLEGWREFVSNPIEWGLFAGYAEKIEHLLFYSYPGYESFNSKFKERLDSMGEDRLKILVDTLYEAIRARDEHRLIKLGQTEADVLTEAVHLAGDLNVGSSSKSWPLRTFIFPTGAKS
jgi:hypothetical protein